MSNNDYILNLLNIIYDYNKNISPKMLKAFTLYKDNIKYIENHFIYDINNGVIESTNNLIKSIIKE